MQNITGACPGAHVAPPKVDIGVAPTWCALLALCSTQLAACGGVDRIPTRVTQELDGNLAVYASLNIDLGVEVERLAVRIDGGEPIPIHRDGYPLSFALTSGRHVIEVVGAFRRRAAMGRDRVGIDPGGMPFTPTLTTAVRTTSSQVFWRRQSVSLRSREGCVTYIRVDAFDVASPDDWSVEAPQIELRPQTQCTTEDDRPVRVITATVAPVLRPDASAQPADTTAPTDAGSASSDEAAVDAASIAPP